MTWEMIFTVVAIACMTIALIMEMARPDIIVFVTLVLFLLFGILTPEEAVKGFSNQGLLTVALLFIIAGTIQKSRIIDQFIFKLLDSAKSQRKTLLRILVPVSGFSAFMNNTPIVITLTPIIRKWCEERKVSPSKFLIPLSYATILGGTMTLMGTSTNLIIHELMIDAGFKGFSFFQLGIVGLPIAIIGIIYVVTVGLYMLPNHKVLTESVKEQSRKYMGEVVVEDHYPHNGKTVEEAGLRHLNGLYLVSIVRGDEKITPVSSSNIIQSGDRLIFTGLISTIEMLQNFKGLHIETNSNLEIDQIRNNNTHLIEAVVSHQSSLLNNKIKETQFRGKYDAAVIAVHRRNERIKSKIGDITLKPGDILLLIAGKDFQNRNYEQDFYIATPIKSSKFPTTDKTKKGWIAVSTLLFMIFLVVVHVLSMFKAIIITTVLLLLFRVITPEDAKHYIQLNVLLLIASSLGIGLALLKTGTANWIANGLVSFAEPFGIIAILTLVYLVTNLFTELITNNAAAVMMFPIAMEIANQLHITPIALSITVAIAASASFSTPIGYQTNLIVYGPGGYKYKDYLKIGIPLNLLVMIVTICIIKIVWI